MAATDHKIAFIGLGVMGAGMASRLAESGYDVTVYNRTRSKAEEVAKEGAKVADSPADAAREADVVMMSLADQNVVEKIVFGDDGVASTLANGAYLVDMSTVPPAYARDLAERSSSAGHKALDACVLGAPFHARSGELRVMVGAQEDDFEALKGIFETIGKDVTYLGGNGMGASMKLVLNMLMGVQMPALAEAIVFGERAGLPRDKILELIAQSGYSSPVMAFRCMLMGQRKFEDPSFKLALMRKDMMLVLDACKELDVPLPVSETAYSMLTAAKQQGLGELDVAAMLAFQERMSGLEGYPWPGSDGDPAS